MAGGEEFVIDVIAKWKDEASGGAGKLDKTLSSLKKDTDSYGKTIDSLGKKMSALKEKQSTLSGALQKAQSQYSSAKSKMDAYGNGATTLQGKLKKMQSEYKGTTTGIKTLEGKIKSATAQGKAGESQVVSLTEALKAQQKKQESLADSIQNTSSRIKNAKQQYKAYSSEVKSSSSALTDLKRQEQQTSEELKKTTSQRTRLQQASLQERYQNAQNTYAATTANTPANATTAANRSSAAISVGSALQKAGGTINKIGNGLTLGVTTPLIAAGTAATKTGIEFENALSQAAGAMDLPMSQMGKMKQLALEMGQETVFSATESAQAITELAKGGLSEANISGGALKSTMDLAASSGMGMADAANVVVQAMGAFGLSADKSDQAVNALAGAAAASSADVTDLSQALAQGSAAAHNAGWSVQDTAAVLAAFADAGIQGSDAGTSLKTMLQRLSSPTDVAAKEMKALGIQVRDSKGNMKDATSIAQELQDKLKKLSSTKRDSALNDIFGSDAMRAATVLMNDGAAGLEKYTKATNDQTAASRMADSQMGNTGRAIENMKGSIETAAITIEGALAPTITDVVNKITELVNAFTNLPSSTQKAIIGLGGVAIAAGPVLKVVGGLTTGIGKVTSFFGKLGSKGAKVASAATGAASTASTVAQAASGGASVASTVSDAASTVAATVSMATGTSKVAKATQAARKEGEAFSKTLARIAPLSQSASAAVGPYSEKLSKVGKTFKETSKDSESLLYKLKQIPTMNTSMDEEAAAMAKTQKNTGKASKAMGTAAKATSKFSGIASKLPGILGIVGAAVGGVTIAVMALHKQAVDKSLQKHFGDIKLSAEEVEATVKSLTTNAFTKNVDAAKAAEQQVQDLEKSLNDTKNSVGEYEWKVKVGMNLSDDEKSDFKTQLKNYAEQSIQYAEKTQYAATLSVKVGFEEGSSGANGMTSFISNILSESQGRLSSLGQQLSQAVNDAFKDNLLSGDEMSNIDSILSKIDAEETKIENARQKVKLRNLKSIALDSGLDNDSFESVVKGVNDANTSTNSGIESDKMDVLSSLEMALENGKMSQSAYDAAYKHTNLSFGRKESMNILENTGFGYDTISDRYGTEMQKNRSTGIYGMNNSLKDIGEYDPKKYKTFIEKASNDSARLFKVDDLGDRGAIQDLAKMMQPSTKQLKEGTKNWIDAGMKVPKAYREGLEKAFETEFSGGIYDNSVMYNGMQLGKQKGFENLVKNWHDKGATLPQDFIEGMEVSSGKIYDASTGLFKEAEDAVQMSANQLNQMYSQLGIKSTDTLAKSIKAKGADVQNAIQSIMTQVGTGGMDATSLENTFASLGAPIETGVANALAAVKPNIQAKMSGLIATLFQGIQLDTSSISSLFSGLGISLQNGLAQSFSGLTAEMQQGILNAVTSVNPQEAIDALKALYPTDVTIQGLKVNIDAKTGKVTGISLQQTTDAIKKAAGDGQTVEATGQVDKTITQNTTINQGTVTDNTGGAAAGSSSTSSSTQTVTVVPQLGDTSQLQSQLSSLTGTAKVNATLGDVSQAQTSLNNLKATAKVTAQADTTAAVTALNDAAKDRNAKIIAIADVATAKSALDSLCVPRTVTITASLNAGTVATEIDALAKDRYATIHVSEVKDGTQSSKNNANDAAQSAAGGIIKGKTLSWLAEEGWPEAVIPFDPARRKRAISLWEQTGEKLGVTPSKHAAGGIVGGGQIIPINPGVVPVTPDVEPAQTSSSGPSIAIGDGAIQITIQASGSDADAIASAINAKDLVDMIANALADKVETVMTNTTNVKGA